MANGQDITRWISTKTAAFRMGYGQSYVAKLARQGKLRFVETELGLLIDPESVEEFKREHPPRRRPGTAPTAGSDDEADQRMAVVA